ncbi:MAG: hypothetical protein ABI716_01990 [Candidatus Saccharibacteria bacterium]
MIEKALLRRLYTQDKHSMMEIAAVLGCSHHQVVYWMNKYDITRRSISDAIYQKHNPNGDPFVVQPIDSIEKAELHGTGMGLYWGEGTRANKYAVRLGNTDPALLNTFIRFLIELFAVNKADLRFGLQIFSDIKQDEALEYWSTVLGVHRSQFYKVHVTISGSIGTYRKKSRYGVVTVYYHNKHLRDILVEMLPR